MSISRRDSGTDALAVSKTMALLTMTVNTDGAVVCVSRKPALDAKAVTMEQLSTRYIIIYSELPGHTWPFFPPQLN